MSYTFDALVALKQKQFTGQLLLSSSSKQWTFYFYLGRLLYGTGGQHCVRRLYRHLAKASNELTFDTLKQLQTRVKYPAQSCWEYEFLTYLVKQGHLAPFQVPKVIHGVLIETFFDVACHDNIQHQTRSKLPIRHQLGLIDPIQLIEQQRPLWEQWRAVHLEPYSLNLAPIIQDIHRLQQETSANVYQTLINLLNGQHTFWDVIVTMNRSPLEVMGSLLPYIQTKIIELIDISDFSPPSFSQSVASPSLEVSTFTSKSRKPLVACVDDSAWVCNTLEKVVTRAGYRFLAIQDPLRAIPTLLAQRPQLILLDLRMPITNGYEICSQLRRISAFNEVPIVILTGSDGIVDRVRAKLVGATDFLSKSVNSTQLMLAINKYLDEEDQVPLLKQPTLNGTTL